jgi:ATP-dependent DNA ligase
LPIFEAPMAASEVQRPSHRPGWVFNEKVDGWRVLACKDAAGVRFVSRNGRDLTRRFPEVATAPEGLEPRTLILDGEIAVFDRQYARGNDLRARPLRVRRNVLEELVALPGGPDNRLAQGEAAALPRGRARLGDEDVAI